MDTFVVANGKTMNDFKIQIAKSATDLDSLFKIRHKVFVEEEGYMTAKNDKRIIDRFDAFPNNFNFVVKNNNEVIGGSRITILTGEAEGSPLDNWFDCKLFMDSYSFYAAGSMLCLLKEFRTIHGWASKLIEFGHNKVYFNGVAYRNAGWSGHVFTAMNPKTLKFFHKHNYFSLGEEKINEENNLPFIPGICDLWRGAERNVISNQTLTTVTE